MLPLDATIPSTVHSNFRSYLWEPLDYLGRWIVWIRGAEEKRILHVIATAREIFESFEKKDLPNGDDVKSEIKRWKTLYDIHDSHWLASVRNELSYLKSLILSTKYRFEFSQRLDSPDAALLQSLIQAAAFWKKNQVLIYKKDLSSNDINRLEELALYPEFVKHLLEFPEEQQAFFTWALRDGNRSAPFVEYRARIKKIVDCNLSTRIGFFGGGDLSIHKIQGRKSLTLLFEGRRCDILDDDALVCFRTGNYTMTIKDIFQEFKDRSWKFGNLEYFPVLGICNWNPKELGYFDANTQQFVRIDLSADWWENLIPMETIDKHEASQRFTDFKGRRLICDGTKWIASIIATSESHHLDAIGNHGFIQIGIPDNQGRYKLYSFGKFTNQFPRNTREIASMIGRFVKGVVAYPDENIFRLDRDRDSISVLWEPSQGMARMESIRKDLLKIRENRFYFQIFVNNCLLWAFRKSKIPHAAAYEMCGATFLSGEPSGALKVLWVMMRWLPSRISSLFFHLLLKNLGGDESVTALGKRGQPKEKSLLQNPPWAPEAEPLHPTALILKIREKRAKESPSV